MINSHHPHQCVDHCLIFCRFHSWPLYCLPFIYFRLITLFVPSDIFFIPMSINQWVSLLNNGMCYFYYIRCCSVHTSNNSTEACERLTSIEWYVSRGYMLHTGHSINLYFLLADHPVTILCWRMFFFWSACHNRFRSVHCSPQNIYH